MQNKFNWDVWGITASLACAIHCVILPLLLTSFSIFGINIIENVKFELAMIFLALIIGSFALYHGFRKHHKNYVPALIFVGGILLLFAKHTWHNWQLWFLLPGVFFIICAHFLNYSLSRKTDHSNANDCVL